MPKFRFRKKFLKNMNQDICGIKNPSRETQLAILRNSLSVYAYLNKKVRDKDAKLIMFKEDEQFNITPLFDFKNQK